MAYVKTTWVDQEGQVRYTETEDDGYKVFTPNFEEVTELGTPVDAVHLNNIENGIDGTAIRKHNLTETFNLNECVLGGTAGKEIIYRSLVPDNVGNAVTDTTKWKKARICAGVRNIGELVYSSLPLTDDCLHLADGSLVSNTDYPALVDYISSIYTKTSTEMYCWWISGVGEYYTKSISPYTNQDLVYDSSGVLYGDVVFQQPLLNPNKIVIRTFRGTGEVEATRYSNLDKNMDILNSPFCTETEWQNFYNRYAGCGYYVYDSENNTVRLPLYNSYFTNTANVDLLGRFTPASLPNIKGEGILQDDVSKCSGAIYSIGSVSSNNSEPGGSSSKLMGFDASKSSAIYSDYATTVNTQSVKQLVYIVVAE